MWFKSSNAQLVSSMKLNSQLVAFLSLVCVLNTVRESDSAFVPGRCLCPKTQRGVRGELKELLVLPQSASCSNVTVIVTLKKNDAAVCLDSEAPMAKQLIHCWKRAHKLGRDVKLCLKRKIRRGGRRQRQRQKRRGQLKQASSSVPQ